MAPPELTIMASCVPRGCRGANTEKDMGDVSGFFGFAGVYVEGIGCEALKHFFEGYLVIVLGLVMVSEGEVEKMGDEEESGNG